jgi:hypothetical protein
MHPQAKEKRARCAPAGQGEEGQMRTSRLRRRGTDVHEQAKEERDRCTRRPRRRGPDVHKQAKEERDRCAPAG